MSKPFFLSNYPCPDCCGNVRWLSTQCPHCQYRPTMQDRFDASPPSAKFILFGITGSSVLLLGSLLLRLVGLGSA